MKLVKKHLRTFSSIWQTAKNITSKFTHLSVKDPVSLQPTNLSEVLISKPSQTMNLGAGQWQNSWFLFSTKTGQRWRSTISRKKTINIHLSIAPTCTIITWKNLIQVYLLLDSSCICQFVSVCDGNQNRWLQKERIPSLKTKAQEC